jgi:hypothetical protein
MTDRFAVSFVAWLVLAGCTVPGEREPLPDWVEDDPPTGTDPGTEPQPTSVMKATSAGNNFPVRLRQTGTEEGPCEVRPDGTKEGYQEIDCTVDVNELDLFTQGINWSVYLTPDACIHVKYWHYMYKAWPLGLGPDNVSYTVTDGVVSNEVNSVGGMPYCEYNHGLTLPGAPNCCLGTFTLTITDGETGEITSGVLGWGGVASECYGGAAFNDPEAAFGDDGFPQPHYDYPNASSYTKEMQFDGLSDKFSSTVPLANFYASADHNDDRPAGLKENGFELLGLPDPEPDYVFQCLDRDEEVLAQIKLRIREYNEQSQMIDDGNPDTVGEEPITGLPIDDFADWAVATPGNTSYIGWVE